MAPPRPSRPLFDQVAQLVRAASTPRTAPELAAVTGLHVRTVYRLLQALPEGYRLDVQETPRVHGSGRPTRRYRIWPLTGDLAAVAAELRGLAAELRSARTTAARKGLHARLDDAVHRLEALAGRRRRATPAGSSISRAPR